MSFEQFYYHAYANYDCPLSGFVNNRDIHQKLRPGQRGPSSLGRIISFYSLSGHSPDMFAVRYKYQLLDVGNPHIGIDLDM